jgi:hypothetical protein
VAGSTAGAGGGSAGAGEIEKKIILFDGSEEGFSSWTSIRNSSANPWRNNGDGTMTVVATTGDIQSKQTFRDVFVHLEYATPRVPANAGNEAGNSGVLLNGSYELQILDRDAFGMAPAALTEAFCGAVYGLISPLELACYEAEVWNTYEIEFQAPICDEGNSRQVVTPARFIAVRLNGTLIHRNVDVPHQTQSGQDEGCEPRGLRLQDWSSVLPVSFRNIWAIPRN